MSNKIENVSDYNELNTSITHRSMSSEDAIRLLKEAKLNPYEDVVAEILGKESAEHLKVLGGSNYENIMSGKKDVVPVSNYWMNAENINVAESEFYGGKDLKGIFFTLPIDNKGKLKLGGDFAKAENVIKKLKEEHYLNDSETINSISSQYGFVAVGEYRGDKMVGTKVTLAKKLTDVVGGKEVSYVKPYSLVASIKAGRDPMYANVYMHEGVEKAAVKSRYITNQGLVVADNQAGYFANLISYGMKNLFNSESLHPVTAYYKGLNVSWTLNTLGQNEKVQKKQKYNAVVMEKLVTGTTLEDEFKNEKDFGRQEYITDKMAKDVFYANSNQVNHAEVFVKNIAESEEEKIAKGIKIATSMKDRTLSFFMNPTSDNPMYGFFTRTNLDGKIPGLFEKFAENANTKFVEVYMKKSNGFSDFRQTANDVFEELNFYEILHDTIIYGGKNKSDLSYAMYESISEASSKMKTNEVTRIKISNEDRHSSYNGKTVSFNAGYSDEYFNKNKKDLRLITNAKNVAADNNKISYYTVEDTLRMKIPYLKSVSNAGDEVELALIDIPINVNRADLKVSLSKARMAEIEKLGTEKITQLNVINSLNRNYSLNAVINPESGSSKPQQVYKALTFIGNAISNTTPNGAVSTSYAMTQIMNRNDIMSANLSLGQGGTKKGNSTVGSYKMSEFMYGAPMSEHRQPHDQSKDTLLEFGMNGKSINEVAVANELSKERGKKFSMFAQGNAYNTTNVMDIEERTAKLFKEAGKGKRTSVNVFALEHNGVFSWQENAVLAKKLTNMQYANEKNLQIRFNQLNNDFYENETIKGLGITNKESMYKFLEKNSQDEIQMKKLFSVLLEKDFNERTLSVMELEGDAGINKYIANSESYLSAKNHGMSTILNPKYLTKEANSSVKTDFGIMFNGFGFNKDMIKLNLANIRNINPGSKVMWSGTKTTVANIFDDMTVNYGGKEYEIGAIINGKHEKRNQSGIQLFNTIRTAMYNLSEVDNAKAVAFANSPLMQSIAEFSGLSIDAQTQLITESLYDSNGAENFYSDFGNTFSKKFDKHRGTGVIKNLKALLGLQNLKVETSSVETNLEMSHLVMGILNEYDKFRTDKNGNLLGRDILLKDAVVNITNNKNVKGSKLEGSSFMFLQTLLRAAPTETKKLESAISYDHATLRMLRETGDDFLADQLESDLHYKAKTKGFDNLAMMKMLTDDYHLITDEDGGDFVKTVLGEKHNAFEDGGIDISKDFNYDEAKEFNTRLNKQELTTDLFFEKSKLGKNLAEKDLYVHGENSLKKSYYSTIKSSNVNKYVESMKNEFGEEFTNANQLIDILDNKRKTFVDDIFKSIKGEKDIEKIKNIILNKMYVDGKMSKELRAAVASDLKVQVENKRKEIIKKIKNSGDIGALAESKYVLKNQIDTFFKQGKMVGILGIDELAVDSSDGIISNQAINTYALWNDMEISLRQTTKNNMSKMFDELKGHSVNNGEIMKVIETMFKTNVHIANAFNTNYLKEMANPKGTYSSNMTTGRIKNSVMLAPANNDFMLDIFADMHEHKDFETHLTDFFGEGVADTILKDSKTNGKIDRNVIRENMKKLTDILITRKEFLEDTNDFYKTLADNNYSKLDGFYRTFGRYIGYPVQTNANVSSAMLILLDNGKRSGEGRNIFVDAIEKNNFLPKGSKQAFFLNKTSWFKALRDFDGDKMQLMYNAFVSGDKDAVYNKLTTKDAYNFFMKNGLYQDASDAGKKLGFTRERMIKDKKMFAWKEDWYAGKLKLELAKHDIDTANIVEYWMSEFSKASGNEAERFDAVVGDFTRKAQIVSLKEGKNALYRKGLKTLFDNNEEHLKKFADSQEYKWFKNSQRFSILTNPYSVEELKSTLSKMSGIKDTGKVHFGVTSIRKLAGTIAFNDINSSFFDGRTGIENKTLKFYKDRIYQIQENMKNDISFVSEVAGMMIEAGAVSSKHGKSAIVTDLIKNFHSLTNSPLDYKTAETAINVNGILREVKGSDQSVVRELKDINAKNATELFEKMNVLSYRAKEILMNTSNFLNSEMKGSFKNTAGEIENVNSFIDNVKKAFEANPEQTVKHLQLTGQTINHISEIGEFIHHTNAIHKNGNYEAEKLIPNNMSDKLFVMDASNNFMSKVKGSAENLYTYLTNLTNPIKDTVKPLVSRFEKVLTDQGERYDKLSKAHDEKVNVTAHTDSILRRYEQSGNSIDVSGNLKSIIQNAKMAEGESLNDVKLALDKLSQSQLDTNVGKDALNNFIRMMRSKAPYMEISADINASTLGIDEHILGVITKMLRK